MKIDELREHIDERETDISKEKQDINSRISRVKFWINISYVISAGIVIVGIIYMSVCKLSLNELGDYLAGTVASVLSLVGILYIYMAFLGQKQQILNQELELLYNRLEIRESREELKGQKEQLEKQNFESAFYTLLGLYHDIMKSFSQKVSGKTFLMESKEYLKKTLIYDNISEVHGISPGKIHYENYFELHKDELAHYFRVLYRLFKFIDESSVLKNDEKSCWFYCKTLRAQLSEAELFLLFYNARTGNGENFQVLIVKYNLLKHLPLKDRLEVERFYRRRFRADYSISSNTNKLEDLTLVDGRRIAPNYQLELPVSDMRILIDGLNSVMGRALHHQKNVSRSLTYEGGYYFYFVSANYKDKKLTVELQTSVNRTNEESEQFLAYFGFDRKTGIEEFGNLLENIMYIKFCLDTFGLQSTSNSEMKWWVSAEHEGSIFVSIERKDKEDLILLTDKY